MPHILCRGAGAQLQPSPQPEPALAAGAPLPEALCPEPNSDGRAAAEGGPESSDTPAGPPSQDGEAEALAEREGFGEPGHGPRVGTPQPQPQYAGGFYGRGYPYGAYPEPGGYPEYSWGYPVGPSQPPQQQQQPQQQQFHGSNSARGSAPWLGAPGHAGPQ